MKNPFFYKKTNLLTFLLIMGTVFLATAQISSGDQDLLRPPLSGDGTTPILVYGGNGFTLTASENSTDNGGTEGIAFTDFDWFITNDNGGGDGIVSGTALESGATPVISGTTINNQLSVSELAPGFYTFTAQGYTDWEICISDPEEFTVFVLAPLTTEVTFTGEEIYCADDLSEAGVLTATVNYDSAVDWNMQTPYTTESPTIEDFELVYNWYKIESGTAFDPATATPITGAHDSEYTINDNNDAEVGLWNYYATVSYEVKASGPYAGIAGGTEPTIIQVTPKPGKPTIEFIEN